jgi:hypothetical protein
MKIIWKDIEGFENIYKINNIGIVKSLDKKLRIGNGFYIKKGRIIKPYMNNSGYLRINLYDNKIKIAYYLHRLLAQTFIINTLSKKEVNHKDGNKLNNNLDNLEWVTSSENKKHAFRIGLKSTAGELSPKHKLTEWDVKIIRKMYKNTKYWTQRKIGELFGITDGHINNIVNYKNWRNI